jgi:inorganic pyrophosphatase
MKCSLLGALALEQTEKGKTTRNDRFIPCPEMQDAEVSKGVPKELRKEIEQFLRACTSSEQLGPLRA